jgi:hypothetical protein
VKRLLLFFALVSALSAQTIVFSPQPTSRLPGLAEYRVYVSAPDGQPMQVKGMQIILEALHQNIRVYNYVNLQAYVDDLNKRSAWRWVGIGMEATAWALTSGNAADLTKIREKWITASIAGVGAALTLGRTLYDREYKPVTLPVDLMLPLIAVPPGGSVDFAVFAARQ